MRYVRIFFGILTLAFGMLFHSFLFKFYDITVVIPVFACCVPRCSKRLQRARQDDVLIDRSYYDCLMLLVVLGFVMCASCIRRSDCI